MKLRLRENLFFKLKIELKNHSIYVVKLYPFPPGTGIFFSPGGCKLYITLPKGLDEVSWNVGVSFSGT